jgi:D-alanine-D-alanine ligase
MNQEEIERVEKIVREIYEKLNCKGVVRVDYFLQKETGKFYFIEINTVPG